MNGIFYSGEYIGKCGYCKGQDCSVSHGMQVFNLSNQNYQELIDRGWRRCGNYCYKPDNKRTCCPSYTIRCDALNFNLTKSHKKLLRRMNNFLRNGTKPPLETKRNDPTQNDETVEAVNERPNVPDKLMESVNVGDAILISCKNEDISSTEGAAVQSSTASHAAPVDIGISGPKVTEIVPAPNELPQRKKAKQLRLERRQAKLAARAMDVGPVKIPTTQANKEKTLAEYIEEADIGGNHKLKIVLVAVDSKEFRETCSVSFKLFQKYQAVIHNEPNESYQSYNDFLQEICLKFEKSADNVDITYGAYHQQYYLDDKLIAVGVIDILPKCVSSVYFFYDPDYSFLSLGTYASLREIAFVQCLAKKLPELKYYYMGFYIHSCPKMRYKGRLVPSYLLCCEAYTWHLLTPAILNKLEAHKYQRFNEDSSAEDHELFSTEDIQRVPIMIDSARRRRFQGIFAKEADNIQEYGILVGKSLAKRLLYYPS